MPSFYRSLIPLWRSKSGGRIARAPRTYEEVCSEPLLGDKMIVDLHQKPLYYPSLARSGFVTVQDIFCKPCPLENTVSATVYPTAQKAIPSSWLRLPQGPPLNSKLYWSDQLATLPTATSHLTSETSPREQYIKNYVKAFLHYRYATRNGTNN